MTARRVTAMLSATLLAAPLLAPSPVLSQDGTSENGMPTWLEAWSPLAPRADLPREIPRAGAVPSSLLLPAPRVGLFWTAGNPGALRAELNDTRTDLAIATSRVSGSYRRPLDPERASLRQVSAHAWSPVLPRLALLGRIVADQERFDPGTQANVVEAYPSSPFVSLDTSTTAMLRTRARLEGALGVQLGGWGLGLALGYEAREHQSIEAGFVRRTRQAVPGATIGLTRKAGPLRFGPYARWRGRAETIFLTERSAQGLVLQLEGLREVVPLEILNLYYRRIEEDVPSVGWSVSAPLRRGSWAVYLDRSRLRERSTRQEADDPAADTWDANAWHGGAAFQQLIRRRTVLTIDARYTTLRGDGSVTTDTTGAIFQANERAVRAEAEWRVIQDSVGWGLAVGAQFRWENRVRNALTIPIAGEVTGVTNSVGIEVSRAFSPRVVGTAGATFAAYSTSSSIPSAEALGPIYRTYLLPEYDVASRPARPWLGAVAVQWAAGPRTRLWIRLTGERVSPTKVSASSFGPEGSRTFIRASTGVTLHGR